MIKELIIIVSAVIAIFFGGAYTTSLRLRNKELRKKLENDKKIQTRRVERELDSDAAVRERLREFVRKE